MAVPSYLQLEADAAAPSAAAQPARPRRAAGNVLRASALLCAGAAATAVVVLRRAAFAPKRGNVGALEEKMGFLAMADALANGLSASAKVVDEAREVYPDVQTAMGSLTGPSAGFKAALMRINDTSRHVNLTQMAGLTTQELLHPKSENRHDGNVCAGDEETHVGLCYKKCSLLTEGLYPIRTTAWSCCHQEPCSFFNSKFVPTLFPCEGFDVAGSKEGQGCPHFAGTCMENEELSLGVCYKKCAILTSNVFPYRSGAASCCRYNSHLACLDALNVNISASFNTAGGAGDHNGATPAKAHLPIPALTEA